MHERRKNHVVRQRIYQKKERKEESDPENGARHRLSFATSVTILSLVLCTISAHAGVWEIDDILERQIDGECYRFRCIDDDYIDMRDTGEFLALFLCDSVIPANQASSYVPEPNANGVYDYQFVPGPIVNFGASADYKYSAIRAWLQKNEAEFADAQEVNTGESCAYFGSTEEGMYSGLKRTDLKPCYVGDQWIKDRLFVLSVDEALEYREWLWRFEGADGNNPESQTGPFCKGYWLRTPFGTERGEDSGMVYIVDLVNGNIRPEMTIPDPDDSTVDAELLATTTAGVRPAFVMKQDLFEE